MPIVADAAVAVRADMARFGSDLKKGTDAPIKSLGQRMTSVLNPKNLAGGLVTAFAGSQVVSFISDATNAAAEFQDSVSATGVIFGEQMIPQMEEWGEKAAQNFGASKQEALSAANVIATLGKSAGLAGQDLVNFSQEMVGLGGDLASMFGGTTQDAITAVSAALRGESEPIRRYGVLLDDATLRQKAFEMGIISTTQNALTPQQRVLAAQASILEQTSDAQGDFLRTSDGMANTQREFAAELANVNIEIGEKLLPIMLKLVTFVKDDVLPVIRDLVEHADLIGSVVGEIMDQVVPGGWARDWAEDLEHAAAAGGDLEGTFTGWGDRAAVWLADGTETFDSAARDLVNGLPVAAQEAQDAAAEVSRQTPGALGDSLRASLSDYQDDLDELTDMAVNSVSDLKERQTIEGILASQELTDALNSDSTRTRLQAMELVTDLVADYELLAPGALGAGELVNPELSRGMQSNLDLVTGAANAIVDAAGNPLIAINAVPWGWKIGSDIATGMWNSMHLISDAAYAMANTIAWDTRFESPPPNPNSPLKNMDKFGGNYVKTIADGMLGALGTTSGAARALAAGLIPNLATGGMPMAAAGGAGVSGGNTYHVELVDKLEVRTVEDIGYGLKKLGEIGVLPGSKQ